MEMKFYEFTQNNSGGSFDVDDKICHRLFIESDSFESATEKAESLGVYFNGCDMGMDCSCCGDRWSKWCDDSIDFPLIYDKSKNLIFDNVESYAQYLADEYGSTKPDARIFYANDTVKEIFSKRVQ